MKILPIVLHKGHIPVVTFFGPVLIIFWVFLRPIYSEKEEFCLLSLIFWKNWRGEGDSNPRDPKVMELAIPRPTRLGDLRTRLLN